MDYMDAILVAAKAAGGKIPGRTVLQKLLYFAAEKGLIEKTYCPHYYGPYSETTLNTLTDLVSIDFIDEKIERDESFGHDWKKYTYTLTEDGKSLSEAIQRKNPAKCEKLNNIVKIAEETTGLDYQILSCASKVHYILVAEEKPLTRSEIITSAKAFNWNLTEEQINKTIEFLDKLGLVGKVSTPTKTK